MLRYLPVFIFYFACLTPGYTQEPAVYNKPDKPFEAGKKASIFYDHTGNITPENVLSVTDFQDAGNKFPVMQVKGGNIWIKVALRNLTYDSSLYFNLPYSNISRIIVFKVVNSKLQKQYESGNSLLLKNTRRSIPNYIVSINLRHNDSALYIFKISSVHPLLFPLFLENKRSIEDSLIFQNTIISIFIGIVLAILFYNLFLFISTSDESYLIYIIYLFFLGLAQLSVDGYAYNFIWPDHPKINQYALTGASALAAISGIIFAMFFLHTKKFTPKIHPLFYFYIAVYFIGIILSLSGNNYLSYQILNYTSLIAGVTLIFVAAYISIKGYKPAYFYLVAWISFLIGMVIFVFRNLNILPYNNFTTYILYGGAAIEVILLSIALADKINILKKEKEVSQAQALKVSRENERLVKEQNIDLERKVTERTEELQSANGQLTSAFKNLKDAQIQLVESEKMASLGQLTAGIAHEINNPINFVKSNIKPLQLDFKDLMEVINEYDKLHNADSNEIQTQLKEITALKKSIDLDFVKSEIENLMKGIEHGAERTAEIVRGLRTFSRLDESVIKTVDIHEGIDSTLILLRSTIPANIAVEKVYTADGNIECYPGKLNQVFMNILSNAVQAIKGKRQMNEHEKISITTKDISDKVIEIRIKDTADGMSKEVKQKIFDPFFTTKEVGEGTGLGLAIVFKIIEEHAGKIEVISEEGKGSEFIITINNSIPDKKIL